VFIVTGDIVAYYPNIPVEQAVPLIIKLFMEYAKENSYPQHKIHTFIIHLQITVKNPLFIRFENQLYQQIRGVPMGAACSPDIANLCERDINIMNVPKIPFYGHYINDCFALVYANSEEEALASIHKVQFDDCCIEWNMSDHYQVFLDMTLYVDEFNKLQHMPYRKNMSHQGFHGYLTTPSMSKEELSSVKCPI
jgi:hypothetical protein